MGILFFATRRDAQNAVKQMAGWKIKIKHTADGYYIACNGTKYLRKDGFVR